MKFSISPSEVLIAAVLVGGIGAAAWRYFGDDDSGGAQALTVQVPTLSFQAADGAVAFDAQCVACHGKSGSGTNQGPPLVHDIYNPGHHADESFWRAVRQGVQQHHWRFGHMAPLPQVSDPQLTAIVRYVRELQQANGIVSRPHQM